MTRPRRVTRVMITDEWQNGQIRELKNNRMVTKWSHCFHDIDHACKTGIIRGVVLFSVGKQLLGSVQV